MRDEPCENPCSPLGHFRCHRHRTEAQQQWRVIDDQTALLHDLISQIDRQETERTCAPTELFSYGPEVTGHFNALLCWEGLEVEGLQRERAVALFGIMDG